MHFSNRPMMNLQSGSYSNLRLLQYSMNSLNSEGYPLHNSSRVVSIFFFFILLYFSFLLLPGRPYHGKLPLRKYRSTCPIVSRSSLLDCSYMIISMDLTNSFVGINTCIPSCPCQVFTISIRNVFPIRVFVAFGQPKVYDEYTVFGRLSPSNQEVVRFDISVYNSFLMHFFNPFQLQALIIINFTI